MGMRQEPKAAVHHRDQPVSFEKGVMEDLTVRQLLDTEEAYVGTILRGLHPMPQKPAAALRQHIGLPASVEVLCCSEARCRGRTIKIRDLVAFSGGPRLAGRSRLIWPASFFLKSRPSPGSAWEPPDCTRLEYSPVLVHQIYFDCPGWELA